MESSNDQQLTDADAQVNSYMDFTDLTILSLIQSHKLAKDISQMLNLSKGAITKRLRKLEASGSIVSSKVGIIKDMALTPKGNSLLEQFTHANTPTQVNYLKTHQIRIEALIFKIPLKSRIIPAEYGALFTGSNVVNSRGYSELVFESTDSRLRLTSKSLIIHLTEQNVPLDSDVLKVYTEIKSKLTQICIEIESKGIHLQRYDKSNYKILPVKTEIAFEHNEIANKAKDEKKPVKLFDKKDGQLRAEVDMSKGFPEFEFKHRKKSWSDATYFNDTMWQLFDGRFQEFQRQTMDFEKVLQSDIRSLVDNQFTFSQNLASHVEAIKKLSEVADNINSSFKKNVGDKVFMSPRHKLGWVEVAKGIEVLK